MTDSKVYKVLFKDVSSYLINSETYSSYEVASHIFDIKSEKWDYVELIEEIKTVSCLRKHGELIFKHE